MLNGIEWNELAAQQLVRYEALFKVIEEIETSEDLLYIANRVASQWKYFANVNRWQLNVHKHTGYTTIQGSRGQASISEKSKLSPWDLHNHNLQRPRLIRLSESPDGPEPPGNLIGRDICEIEVFPFTRENTCIGVLSVASRHEPFSELDNKFIRIFGNYFVNRVSDILFRMEATEALVAKATRDALTGLLNRGTFTEKLDTHMSTARKTGQPLSIILADVDYFKPINDTYGHIAGDMVLRAVANRLENQIRATDHIGRYGGEEFIFLLYPCDEKEATQAAERFRQSIAYSPIRLDEGKNSHTVNVTISLGTATLNGCEMSIEAFIKKADDALYAAKANGRNQVVTERGVLKPKIT